MLDTLMETTYESSVNYVCLTGYHVPTGGSDAIWIFYTSTCDENGIWNSADSCESKTFLQFYLSSRAFMLLIGCEI